MSEVRVRFAPSPTGYLHVGGARTALFNYLFARHAGGRFLLRIEDTDRERSTPEAVRQILDALRWLGLDWDGEPAIQSARCARHREAAESLVRSGAAFPEETERGRALRFRFEPGEVFTVADLVRGPVRIAPEEDLVILKSDGFPTYNFACVVDDHDQGITHVIRGDDHLVNTPKQLALYRALGWTPPAFAHLPMIHNPDGTKMSKRDQESFPPGQTGVVSPAGKIRKEVEAYREAGYLPEALFNFLALLGWSPGDDRELLTREELVALFDLARCRPSAARFDVEKLNWLNGVYLRERLAPAALEERLRVYLRDRGFDAGRREPAWYARFAALYRERAETLADFAARGRYLLADDYPEDAAAVAKHLGPAAAGILRAVRQEAERVSSFLDPAFEQALRALAATGGGGLGKVAQPLRVAVTGGTASPPLFDTLELLGRERVLGRLDRALERLGAGG